MDADITPPQGTSGDPLARVYTLLRAAGIQGMEGFGDTLCDLPGIRLGLRRFLETPDPYSGNELYDAVLAAVSRGIRPERLVGYVEAVLANRKSEHRELGARAVIGVPDEYVKDWLENRLCTPIRRTLSGIAGQKVKVEFRITDQTDLPSRLQQVKA